MSLDNYISKTARRPLVVAGVVLLVLQLTLGGHFQIFGCTPDYLLVLAAVIAFSLGSVPGMLAGFGLGLLADLLGSAPVGISALLFCALFFLVNGGERNMLSEGWRVPSALVFLLSLVYNVLYLVVLAVMGTQVGAGIHVLLTVLITVVLDTLVAAIVFFLLSRIYTSGQLSSRGLL